MSSRKRRSTTRARSTGKRGIARRLLCEAWGRRLYRARGRRRIGEADGRGVSARDYLHLLRECGQLKRDWAQALAGCDALLTPTTLTAAPRVADIDQSGSPAVFTRAINLVGGCALALPNGFTRSGLPTSLQIACPAYQEATALQISGCQLDYGGQNN